MTSNPKCRTCGKLIYGVPLEATRYGRGWLHQNNRETCSAPHRAVAEPVTVEDLNAKTLRDAERSRRRAGVKPR